MRKRIPLSLLLSMLLVLLCAVSAPAEEEEDPTLVAAIKQIGEARGELEKLYKIQLDYEISPRNVMTLNDVFGFIVRIKGVLQDTATTNWSERISSLSGLKLHLKNTEDRDAYLITEIDANATMSFNRRDDSFEDLAEKLCREKESFLKLSEMVRKLKVDMRMGKDMSWARAAVFIRMLEDYMKSDKKAARIMKDFVIMLVKDDEIKPDYENKTISVPYRIDKDRLSARLEEHKKEYEAFAKCKQYEDNLAKLNVVIQYDKVFSEFVPINFYRLLKDILAKLDQLARNPASNMKMMRKPILINDRATDIKEDAYYVSIHGLSAIDDLFK